MHGLLLVVVFCFKDEEGVSAVLKTVELQCERMYDCGQYVYPFWYLSERMFCAGEKHGSTDACAADIGGPAVYLTEGKMHSFSNSISFFCFLRLTINDDMYVRFFFLKLSNQGARTGYYNSHSRY